MVFTLTLLKKKSVFQQIIWHDSFACQHFRSVRLYAALASGLAEALKKNIQYEKKKSTGIVPELSLDSCLILSLGVYLFIIVL